MARHRRSVEEEDGVVTAGPIEGEFEHQSMSRTYHTIDFDDAVLSIPQADAKLLAAVAG